MSKGIRVTTFPFASVPIAALSAVRAGVCAAQPATCNTCYSVAVPCSQSEAVTALHNLLRGCPDNQRALAALPAASEVLRGALAGYGPCWHPAKGDLHALLNVLARLQVGMHIHYASLLCVHV